MSSLEEASHFAKSRGTTLGRGYVTIDDCVPGVIVFIKKCQYIFYRDFVESGLSIAALRHPALVIRRVESKASHVLICPLTTFGGRTVQERYPHNRVKRNNYLPIHPRSPITPRGVQLHTAGEALKKPGYINIGETYIVHTDMLRAYDWDFATGDYRLTEASFGQVIWELRRLGTIPRDTTSQQSRALPTIQDTMLHTVPSSYGTETLLLSIPNHDIQRGMLSIVYQLPRKLISSFVLLLILFIAAYFVLGYLQSS